jgi:hypothetical protein
VEVVGRSDFEHGRKVDEGEGEGQFETPPVRGHPAACYRGTKERVSRAVPA